VRKQAVTLIELLVGLAVVAAIAGATVVSFSLVDRRRLEIDGRNLAADMQWARQRAVNERENYFVAFNLTEERYDIYRQAIAADNRVKAVQLQTDLATVTFPRIDTQTTFTEIAINPPEIRFSPPLGRVTRANGNPISNIGWGSGNPVHVVMIKVSRAGRDAGITLFADTGFASYKPEYDPSKKGWCFIATAAYQGVVPERFIDGGQVAQEIKILQEFRDRSLAASAAGRACIEMYYYLSPSLASYIARRPWACRATRALLQPAVWMARRFLEGGR